MPVERSLDLMLPVAIHWKWFSSSCLSINPPVQSIYLCLHEPELVDNIVPSRFKSAFPLLFLFCRALFLSLSPVLWATRSPSKYSLDPLDQRFTIAAMHAPPIGQAAVAAAARDTTHEKDTAQVRGRKSDRAARNRHCCWKRQLHNSNGSLGSYCRGEAVAKMTAAWK